MTKRSLLFALGGLLALAPTFGCGNGDNNLSTAAEPAMQLSTPTNGALELLLPTRAGDPQRQSPPIEVSSSGEADLTITEVGWVGEKPDRVFMVKRVEEDASENSCDHIFAAGNCIITGTPPLPDPLTSGRAFAINLWVSAYEVNEDNVIACPDPPEGVPSQFADRYCGAIRIKSDATNTSGGVEDGTAIVYLLADRASGSVRVPATLTFQNVGPGFSGSRQFSITNEGEEPLQLERVQPNDFGNYITISGPDLPSELAEDEFVEFTLLLEVPADIPESQLETMSNPSTAPQIRIDSSAAGAPHFVSLDIDTSQVVPPIPQPDATQIVFTEDGDEQDLVFTNPGSKPVNLTGIAFDPPSAESYYTVLDDEGEAFQGPLVMQTASESNPERNQTALTLRYTAPSDDASPLTSMIVSYSYFVGQIAQTGSLRVTLMGDRADAAYGELVPLTMTYSAKSEEAQSRTAAIFNLGTAPLELQAPEYQSLNPQSGFEEFGIQLLGGASWPVTIAPQGLQLVEVTFTPSDETPDQVIATMESNSATEALEFTLSSQPIDPTDAELTVVPSFEDEAGAVGELLTLTLGAEVPQDVANNAEWALIGRPEGSDAAFKSSGPSVGLVPDAAGDYEVLVTSSADGLDVQTRYAFSVAE